MRFWTAYVTPSSGTDCSFNDIILRLRGKHNFKKFVINLIKEIIFRSFGTFNIHLCILYFNFFFICK